MNNIQKLSNGTNNEKLLAETILAFMNSQGFYSRLYQEVNNLEEIGYRLLCETLEKQNFKDVLDVIFWLET